MFDEDGGGTIDIDEVQKLVVSLLKLTENPLDEENIKDCVKVTIFLFVSKDKRKRMFL